MEQSDHDILLIAVTKLEAIHSSLDDLKASMSSKADLDRVKDLETRFVDQEKNVRGLDRKVNWILGGIAVFEVLFQFVFKHV